MDYLNGTWCFRMPKESSHARMSHVECLFQIMFVELQVQIPHPNPSTACKVPCQTWKLFLWKLFFWDSPRISQILSAFCLLNCLVVADSRFGFPFAWLCCNAWFWCKQLKLSHVRSDHFGLRGLELLMLTLKSWIFFGTDCINHPSGIWFADKRVRMTYVILLMRGHERG